MVYEKRVKILSEEGEAVYTYYIKRNYSVEFECLVYDVGIEVNGKRKEIGNFSPDFEEAERFCDYIYREHVSQANLFLIAEEFLAWR